MNLKTWLTSERGRATALASHLGVTDGRISQMADEGVPTKHMFRVRAFTRNAVTLESMVQAKTPSETPDQHAPPVSKRRQREVSRATA